MQDPWGKTALQYAASHGSHECIHVLARHGANVFHTDHVRAWVMHAQWRARPTPPQ